MIKINLAKQAGKSGGKVRTKEQVQVSDEAAGQQELQRGLLVRFALILLPSICLYIYQEQSIPTKIASLAQLRKDLDVVSTKNRNAQSSVDEIKKFEKDQERLQNQINALNAVAKDRVREIRVLDYIQREIPQRVWLTSLDLKDGRIQISGMATADVELTTFMDALQRSAYLKEVNLQRSQEATHPDFGLVKKFDINCVLEKTL